MGRFLASVGEAEGFARQARYYVEFGLPKGLDPIISPNIDVDVPATGQTFDSDENSSIDFKERQQFTSQKDFFRSQNGKRRVQSFCRSINLPGRSIEQVPVQHNGPPRNISIDHTYGQITARFYSDKYLRERQFFELWQRCAVNLNSHNLNFYDNYVADMNIYQLGSFVMKNERDSQTYACQIFDAFPVTIGDIQYNASSNDVVEFDITFSYRYWLNYYLDKEGKIDVGKSSLDEYEIKKTDRGLLGKLPPTLRRAGKQVIEQIGRNTPTGRITGGRVFPPFL
jgi:hypothetical protein